MEKKKIKVTFDPNAFADFDGTQEELDEFVQQITEFLSDPALAEKYEEFVIGDVEIEDADEEDTLNKKRLH